MKKDKRPLRPRALELKTERLIVLTEDRLEAVVGGNKTTVPSQCVTLCF